MDNKKFIEELALRTGLEKNTVESLTGALCEVIVDQVNDNNSIVVPSFGVFDARKKMERVVVHPSRGKKILVPPRIILGFRPALQLKQKIK